MISRFDHVGKDPDGIVNVVFRFKWHTAAYMGSYIFSFETISSSLLLGVEVFPLKCEYKRKLR